MKKSIKYIIAIALIIVIGIVLFFVLRGNSKHKPDEIDEDYKSIGLKTDKEVDHFSNLSFEDNIQEIYSDGSIYARINGETIEFANINKKSQTIKTPGVKSIIYNCNCNGCSFIAYLNDKNELYYIELDSKKDTYKKPQLLTNDAASISKISTGDLRHDECGDYYIIYKDKNDIIYEIGYNGRKIEKIDVSKLKYKVVTYKEFKVLISHDENILGDLLKTDESKVLVAKSAYYNAVDYEKLYVIGEDDYMYYFDSKNIDSLIGKKLNESKVKKISSKAFDFTFTFEDGEKLDLFVEQVY